MGSHARTGSRRDRLAPPVPRRGRGAALGEPEADLREAIANVVREAEWAPAALSIEDGQALAMRLQRFVETGEDDGTELDVPDRVLMCRLIQLTRAELLSGGYRLLDQDLVALLRSLERARVRFEPEWHHPLLAGLTGANALDLVVELVHDLRSPLTSIMFLSETLRKGQSGEINDIQKKQLGIIYSAAFGLVSVASDVIDMAREDRVSLTDASHPVTFSLGELIEAVRVMIGPMAEEKNLEVRFSSPRHDIRVGQPVPLGRVLLNLTTNALKFSEHGCVELTAREVRGRRIEFSVQDTGRGMDAETIRTMYEPFRRSRSSTGFHFSGTGLGLAISRRMVELMGGELNVESRLGEGTRFAFEIELPRGSRI